MRVEDKTHSIGVSHFEPVLQERHAQPEHAASSRAAACQLEEKPRRMRTRQRPNSCEEASVRKRRQPTLLTTPAERHHGEERENEHDQGDLHSGR